MAKDTKNRSELERELAARRESIERRIDNLEDEIVSTPRAIKKAITSHPVVGVAGAVAVGLAVSLLFTGRRRRTRSAAVHQELVEKYIDAIGQDVRRRTRRGKDVDLAVRESLQNRTPLIVYSPQSGDATEPSRGMIRKAGDILITTVLGFVVKSALDLVSARLNVQELHRLSALEEDERRNAEAEPSLTANGATGAYEAGSSWTESPSGS